MFRLSAPDGESSYEADAATAHRLIAFDDLYRNGRFQMAIQSRVFQFKANPDAARDLRAFMEAGLAADPEHCEQLRRQFRRLVWRGVVIFVVSAGLFAGYCIWAFLASNAVPPPWLRWLGSFIHFGLIVLLAGSIVGPVACYVGLRDLKRLRNIQRLS